MNLSINELIEKYCEYVKKTNDLIDKYEFKLSDKYSDKAVEIYVLILDKPNGREVFEKLFNHEDDSVAFSAAVYILNGEDNQNALSAIKRIMKNKNYLGERARGYYERHINKDQNREYWLNSLEKTRNKLKEKGKIIDLDVESKIEEDEPTTIPFSIPIFNDDKSEQINKFMRELYKGEYTKIVDEKSDNQNINIDINIIKQKEEEFYVVYTTGMSDFPMNVPKTLFGRFNKYKFGELMILIHESWGNDFKTKEWLAVIKLLRELAMYPHLCNTWIASGHSMEIDMSELSDKYVGVGLVEVTNLKQKLIVDKKWIHMNMVIPMYKEELDYKLKYGYDKWFENMSKIEPSPYLLKLNRRNSIK